MRSGTVRIDCDEGDPASYRGIIVTERVSGSHKVIGEWRSGDPAADWANFMVWVETCEIPIGESSSMTHFVQDVPGWRFIMDEHDREILVPDSDDTPRLMEEAP